MNTNYYLKLFLESQLQIELARKAYYTGEITNLEAMPIGTKDKCFILHKMAVNDRIREASAVIAEIKRQLGDLT